MKKFDGATTVPDETVKLSTRRIRHQGTEVDCCTSCALAACLEALHPDYDVLSPLYHYHLSRSGRTGDRGLTATRALKGARKHGLCLWELHDHPISLSNLDTSPTRAAVRDGKRRRLASRREERVLWRYLRWSDRLYTWKRALDREHPLFLAIWLDDAYRAMRGNATSTWEPVGPPGRRPGHAVAVVGYDDSERHFIVQDSRGKSFGAGGQWFLPYRTCQSNMIEEAYEVRRE